MRSAIPTRAKPLPPTSCRRVHDFQHQCRFEGPSAGVSRPLVVIVGAGFGGLNAAKALSRKPVDVLILDRYNYHLFQPLLYQVATGGLEPGEIAYPVRRTEI